MLYPTTPVFLYHMRVHATVCQMFLLLCNAMSSKVTSCMDKPSCCVMIQPYMQSSHCFVAKITWQCHAAVVCSSRVAFSITCVLEAGGCLHPSCSCLQSTPNRAGTPCQHTDQQLDLKVVTTPTHRPARPVSNRHNTLRPSRRHMHMQNTLAERSRPQMHFVCLLQSLRLHAAP